VTQRLPRWAWALLACAVALVAGALFVGPRERLALAGAIGRFHPALVHLPIGALVAAAVLVALDRSGRTRVARAAITPVLVVAALGAIAAVVAGQALAGDGAYAGSTFDWHRVLGYVVAVLTTVAAAASWLADRPEGSRFRPAPGTVADVTVGIGVVLLGLTGHLGGTLTHGEGYLTERLPPSIAAWFGAGSAPEPTRRVQPGEVVVYSSLVAPILEDHCVDCHGPSKANGDLRLDTPERITAGGRTGKVLVAGQAAASDLIRRLWLPPSHKDVMPPKSHPPIPVADATVLRWWVDQGASFEASLADVELSPDVSPAIQARVGDLAVDGPALPAVDPGALDTAALAALAAQGLPVSRLAEGVDWLQVEARGRGQVFGDAQLEALATVGPHVLWMDLGGTAVTDAGLRLLSTFPHLTRLHLDRTAVTDAGLEGVAGLAYLEALNIYQTKVTDAGLQRLAAVAPLRTVYLANTAVTVEGLRAASAARPDLVLHSPLTATAAAPPAAVPATRPAPAR
jgi:uncharacterized membrane protein